MPDQRRRDQQGDKDYESNAAIGALPQRNGFVRRDSTRWSRWRFYFGLILRGSRNQDVHLSLMISPAPHASPI
jgi:hypothetical protein